MATPNCQSSDSKSWKRSGPAVVPPFVTSRSFFLKREGLLTRPSRPRFTGWRLSKQCGSKEGGNFHIFRQPSHATPPSADSSTICWGYLVTEPSR